MTKLDQLKALGEAKRRARKNTPEASGTARKAPSGALLGAPSRNIVRASHQKPEQSKAAVPAPIRARGRPKVEGKRPWELEGIPRRTWYRRQKESKSEKGG